MLRSDCQCCDGVMYVKFHKQVFPQWLASDHHSANTVVTLQCIPKIRQSLHLLLRNTVTQNYAPFITYGLSTQTQHSSTAHKLSARNIVLSYFILHIDSRNRPISDPLFSYNPDSPSYSSHPSKYIVAVKPHSSSLIHLLIQPKYHTVRTLWYMSILCPITVFVSAKLEAKSRKFGFKMFQNLFFFCICIFIYFLIISIFQLRSKM